MVEDLPDVPPALVLLSEELKRCASPIDARRRIRGMFKELRQQSEVYKQDSIQRSGYEKDPLRFDVHLHGGLDLLLPGQSCQYLECRIQAADRLARSIGLIADRVWLTDLLTEQFTEGGRITNARLDRILADTLVLLRLAPLISAGIVRFRSPLMPSCSACAGEFERQVSLGVNELLTQFFDEFRIEGRADGGYVGFTGRCFEPTLTYHGFTSPSEVVPTVREFAQSTIEDALRSAIWVAREASLSRGVVFSNSPVGLAGLLQCDGRLMDRKNLLLQDSEREFNVPWVTELSVEQVVQLRDEASTALPVFREQIAHALTASDVRPKIGDVIADLREQSAVVRAELDAKRSNSARYRKVTYGLLGLALSAYGVASDQILPGVAGLLGVIHLLITHRTGHEAEVAALTSRPGYVLVKAQDILAHRHRP